MPGERPFQRSANRRVAPPLPAILCALFILAAVPVRGAPAPEPAPTALELIARMEAALPREGTVVLEGAESMPDGFYRRRLAALQRSARRKGRVLGEWPQEQEFRQTLSFKPGFYQKRCETEKKGAWRVGFNDWLIWRPDCSRFTARRTGSDRPEFRGFVTYEPYPAEMPHEFLFQPRCIQEWIEPSTLTLTEDAAHWIVECNPRRIRRSRWMSINYRVRLAFPKSRSAGDLPDRIKLFTSSGAVEASFLDFRPDGAGRFLPARFTYQRHGGWQPRASGELRVVSASSRFADGPRLPAARAQVLDNRIGKFESLEVRLDRAPPPLWLVRLHLDWRQGVIRIPLGGQVFFGPLLQPAALMLLLLALALGQRSYLRRRRRLSPP